MPVWRISSALPSSTRPLLRGQKYKKSPTEENPKELFVLFFQDTLAKALGQTDDLGLVRKVQPFEGKVILAHHVAGQGGVVLGAGGVEGVFVLGEFHPDLAGLLPFHILGEPDGMVQFSLTPSK